MNLVSYFYLNFQLMQLYGYSLTDLENMIPWERKIYTTILNEFIKDENLKIQQSMANKGMF